MSTRRLRRRPSARAQLNTVVVLLVDCLAHLSPRHTWHCVTSFPSTGSSNAEVYYATLEFFERVTVIWFLCTMHSVEKWVIKLCTVRAQICTQPSLPVGEILTHPHSDSYEPTNLRCRVKLLQNLTSCFQVTCDFLVRKYDNNCHGQRSRSNGIKI